MEVERLPATMMHGYTKAELAKEHARYEIECERRRLEREVIQAAKKHMRTRVAGHTFDTTAGRCPACKDQAAFYKATRALIAFESEHGEGE